jgi:protein-S-isoprenylcysteine O-methyltransferase Ste14
VPTLLIFLLASAALIWVSRASLRRPRSHGFHRFFAWEAILGLILINLDRWFREPLSPAQIVSWLVLLASAFLAVHGFHVLRNVGEPDNRREDDSLIGVERTTRLVTVGAYRYIRHPMYASLLFLAWGAWLKDPTVIAGLLAFAATVFLVLTAKAEEVENIRFFGSAYREYMGGTRMFIPFLF